MPLYDLGQDAAKVGDLYIFRMADGATERRVVVQVTEMAVQDVHPQGFDDLDKFSANRGLFGDVASDKYDRGDLLQAEPAVVRVLNSDL